MKMVVVLDMHLNEHVDWSETSHEEAFDLARIALMDRLLDHEYEYRGQPIGTIKAIPEIYR